MSWGQFELGWRLGLISFHSLSLIMMQQRRVTVETGGVSDEQEVLVPNIG